MLCPYFALYAAVSASVGLVFAETAVKYVERIAVLPKVTAFSVTLVVNTKLNSVAASFGPVILRLVGCAAVFAVTLATPDTWNHANVEFFSSIKNDLSCKTCYLMNYRLKSNCI